MLKRIHSFSFFLSGFFLLIDQIVKNYFVHHQNFSAYFFEQPWIGLEYFENPGVAFGIPVPNEVTLIYTPFVLLGLLLFLFKKNASQKKILSLSLITFGALSNFIDRISVGFTIDYLRFITSIFNIADIMIVVGAIFILFEEIKNQK